MSEDIRTLSPGDCFFFKGFDWIVLDNNVDGGVMAIMAATWNDKKYKFDENGNNNYIKSNLRKKLLSELIPHLGTTNLIRHEIDLVADNGDNDYGKITDKVFILSQDEYKKYRKYIPYSHYGMWTCTPWFAEQNPLNGIVRTVHYEQNTSVLYSSTTDCLCEVLPVCVFNPKNFKVKKDICLIEV